MNKYILLDFDGVITSNRYSLACRQEHLPPNIFGLDWFDPKCIDYLRAIIDETGAGIVISSSWRDLGDNALESVWEHNKMPGRLAGTTPIWILTKKEALEAWIKAHPDDRYVILDDADLKMDFQIKPDPEVGLTSEDADKVVKFLEMGKRYLNERHLRHCVTQRKAVEKMARHPLSREEMKAQCDRNKARLEESGQTTENN